MQPCNATTDLRWVIVTRCHKDHAPVPTSRLLARLSAPLDGAPFCHIQATLNDDAAQSWSAQKSNKMCAWTPSPITVSVPLRWMRAWWRDKSGWKVVYNFPTVSRSRLAVGTVEHNCLSWLPVEKISAQCSGVHTRTHTVMGRQTSKSCCQAKKSHYKQTETGRRLVRPLNRISQPVHPSLRARRASSVPSDERNTALLGGRREAPWKVQARARGCLWRDQGALVPKEHRHPVDHEDTVNKTSGQQY